MKPRPDTLSSVVTNVQTGYGKVYITITEQDNKPYEVFVTIGKSGGSLMAKAEAIGRLISFALRNDLPVQGIIEQLKDISDDKPLASGKRLIKSIPDAVAQVLEERYGKGKSK
jgi:ribonucleoside-diphosphate reductase alpha chain